MIAEHLQDAIAQLADMAYQPQQRRFAVMFNRFMWEDVQDEAGAGAKAYKDQVGGGPSACQARADRSGFEAGGMYRYPGWITVNKWMDDNFKNFDSGKQSASDYGKGATDFINANLMKA